MAELVDAADSKSVVREDVLVRLRPGAPLQIRGKIQSETTSKKSEKVIFGYHMGITF